MPPLSTTRTLIAEEPFLGKSSSFEDRGVWPGHWIGDPRVHGEKPAVTAFRRSFTMDEPAHVRIHVSADERYELFLDGERIGRGPERGDPQNWFFETYDLDFDSGLHVLVARTWWMGANGNAPYAQMTVRPGFLLVAEGSAHVKLTTGVSDWDSEQLLSHEFLPLDARIKWVGSKLRVRGNLCDWRLEKGEGECWQPAEIVGRAQSAALANCAPLIWRLRPAILPPMFEQSVRVGKTRHVQQITSLETKSLPVLDSENLPEEVAAWNQLIIRQETVTIPPRTRRRVIIDLGNYFCAYPQIITTAGAASVICMHWAESLFELRTPVSSQFDKIGNLSFPPKGNRDQIEGKAFDGVGDIFEPDGGSRRHFQTLWWEAGRYLELTIATADEPLKIEDFWLVETHYPNHFENRFESSDSQLAEVAPLALRALQMCSHETYMDCPYYEQLMYVGDTRLEALTTYTICRDNRLPRKALLMFDLSRRSTGLTQSCYPSRFAQIIPPFSLWWIAMVHDYAMWRDDREFVAARMPGVRGVLDAFRARCNRDHLLEAMEGWNFTDWVPTWKDGIQPASNRGISAALNFQLIWIMRQAAELEESLGETELAARNRRNADALVQAAIGSFWDEQRGIFADDLSHQKFSEHTQCLAVLAGCVQTPRRERVVHGLLHDPDLSRTTIYFMHYLFETYRLLEKPDLILARMGLWFELRNRGLRTTIEMPEPCRSDCHAWGAHPVFHFHASILGIRPASVGFNEVRIEPQLGSLEWARGAVVHPQGTIRVDFAMRNGRLAGEVELPDGVSGELLFQGRRRELAPGNQTL